MNTTPSPVPPKHCADCVLRRQPGFTSVTPEQLACIESFRADIKRVRAGQAVVPAVYKEVEETVMISPDTTRTEVAEPRHKRPETGASFDEL